MSDFYRNRDAFAHLHAALKLLICPSTEHISPKVMSGDDSVAQLEFIRTSDSWGVALSLSSILQFIKYMAGERQNGSETV